MSNRITDKYFTQEDFSQKEKNVLGQVTKQTGFQINKEIFRGQIYREDKVGSLIYSGSYNGKPAVLKLQGLEPEIDEIDMYACFNQQNQSKIIRLPEIYQAKKWNKQENYGYLIIERIADPNIFHLPFADPQQRKTFGIFYQEYRTRAITRPWFEPNENTQNFINRRLKKWLQIMEHTGRLETDNYQPYLEKFMKINDRLSSNIPLIFCHSHLTANDIFVQNMKKFILMSNLFWDYRPKFYDLAFNVWACLINIRDISFSYRQTLRYTDDWKKEYEKILYVRQNKDDFSWMFYFAMLERTIGSILADLGAGQTLGKPKNAKYFRHLLKMHQNLFDYFYEKIN